MTFPTDSPILQVYLVYNLYSTLLLQVERYPQECLSMNWVSHGPQCTQWQTEWDRNRRSSSLKLQDWNLRQDTLQQKKCVVLLAVATADIAATTTTTTNNNNNKIIGSPEKKCKSSITRFRKSYRNENDYYYYYYYLYHDHCHYHHHITTINM
jgi:hypothetical protein